MLPQLGSFYRDADDNESPPVSSGRASGGSIPGSPRKRSLMGRFLSGFTSEKQPDSDFRSPTPLVHSAQGQPRDADDDQVLSDSTGSFTDSMRARQNLLRSLLDTPNDLVVRSPSAPTTPISSPRSSARMRPFFSSRGYREAGSANVSVTSSPSATPSTFNRSLGSSVEGSSNFSLVSTNGSSESSTDRDKAEHKLPLSPMESSGNAGSGDSSGSEKVRRSIIKNFSFEIDIKDLKFSYNKAGEKRLIGEGSSAQIHLARWNGTPCAVKRMSGTQAGRMALERFQEEIALLISIRHPNIIQVFGGCWPQADESEDRTCNLFTSCIVMEYCSMGSLFDVIRHSTSKIPWKKELHRKGSEQVDLMLLAAQQLAVRGEGGSFKGKESVADSLNMHRESNQYKYDWVRQIARGMTYLHGQKNPIMHRDLKCCNVLVGKGYSMKIADFGGSRRKMKTTDFSTMSQTGTLLFMAPEMVTERDYDIAVDVYSFAVLLIELFTDGDLLNFYKVAPALAMHKAVGGWRPDLTEMRREEPELVGLIERCWVQDPEERPSFDDILTYLNAVLEEDSDCFSRTDLRVD